MPIHKKLNHDFFKTWSPEMAYVLGYFAADGSMIANKRGGYYTEITSTDRVLIEIVRRVTCATQKIARRVRKKLTDKVQYRIQIGSSEWYQDLVGLGLTSRKSNTLRLPAVPKSFLSDFVRGYFDGDGCIYVNHIRFADRKKRRLIVMSLFTSGSRVFLSELHHALCHNGIVGGSLVAKKRGYELKFSHRDSVALYRFLYDTRRVLLYLPRKRAKFEKAMRLLGSKVRS